MQSIPLYFILYLYTVKQSSASLKVILILYNMYTLPRIQPGQRQIKIPNTICTAFRRNLLRCTYSLIILKNSEGFCFSMQQKYIRLYLIINCFLHLNISLSLQMLHLKEIITQKNRKKQNHKM